MAPTMEQFVNVYLNCKEKGVSILEPEAPYPIYESEYMMEKESAENHL